MFRAEFICVCGFTFHVDFADTEVTHSADLESFYVRCPRCGEEASPRSFELDKETGWRRRDWF